MNTGLKAIDRSWYLVIGGLDAAPVSRGFWSHEAFSSVPESINGVSDYSGDKEAAEDDEHNIAYTQTVLFKVAIPILETVSTLAGEAVDRTGAGGTSANH